ncbi:class I SAM-dependent methyltransferase [Paenibacillus sp. OAS669]|uniref:class I SAM-dependent methyltransferase n=1 Tax=Paenibacillus sp. OAS669 TaxID=2663821 RepID=UPI00178A1F48|nr:class I SAM-dependent methyltransferase [Paenibacillus sp. OAS669]MBE1446764.1 SAM-dependent methyltransferase [Paenibacillus sp. OAS669]
MDHKAKAVWNEWSDTWYRQYRTEEAIAKLIDNPASAFHPAAFALLNKALPSFQGKKICVPSSGDNHAVFAFHLLGAQVTSCDISERQLENSEAIARQYGWDIEFVCDDTMELSKLQSGAYDLVYTSNGVHIWIHDLASMYTQIHRILKDQGAYLMYDVHPFNRPFGKNTDTLQVVYPYDSIIRYEKDEVPRYAWRVQDLLNAIVSSGLSLRQIEEMADEAGSFWIDGSQQERDGVTKEELDRLRSWQSNPLAALPQWLSIYAVK